MEIGILPLLICMGSFEEAVFPAPKALRVGCIFVVGNERTDDGIVRGMLRLYPGKVFELTEVRAAEQRLVHSGYSRLIPTKASGPASQFWRESRHRNTETFSSRYKIARHLPNRCR